MNELIHTAPPSALGRWLARSVGAIALGSAAFVPIGYWVGSISRDDKGSQLLVLIGITLTQIVVWRKGIADFRRAYSDSLRPAAWALKALAGLWFWLLLVLFAMATLFNGMGWLMLGDDGKKWSV